MIEELNGQVIACRKCERLVDWREQVAAQKRKSFADWDYWGKAVPSFGVSDAGLLIIGLAPAAHGANRTGRMFTGDRSGDWLYRALHKAEFANQPESVSREDGLELSNCFVSAVCRCAPPQNKPTAEEITLCSDYLALELEHFFQLWENNRGAILCLGGISFRYTLQQMERSNLSTSRPRPKFGHRNTVELTSNIRLFCSYHPSQQNTFTGRLTEPMFDAVFSDIRNWIG